MGRSIAIIGPISPHVTSIESIPVSGVVIRNDMQAERLAPFFLRVAVIGITPQEHIGRGNPNAAAVVTLASPSRPISRITVRWDIRM